MRECTCGTMSFIMKRSLIVKSSLLIMSPFWLIIGTMSPAHCAIKYNEGNNEPNNEANYMLGQIPFPLVI